MKYYLKINVRWNEKEIMWNDNVMKIIYFIFISLYLNALSTYINYL